LVTITVDAATGIIFKGEHDNGYFWTGWLALATIKNKPRPLFA
jgi:hypothetical protein